jgi:hypothetical protein
MECAAQLSVSRFLLLILVSIGLLLGVTVASSAAPVYSANLTNAMFVQNGPSPVFLSSSQDLSEGRHAEGRVSSGSVLAASLETSKGASGFNNGISTDYSAILATSHDDIIITGPPAASIPVTLHVPFYATFTQSWSALDLPNGGFTDYSSLSQTAELFARLTSPTFGFASGRFTLGLNDKDDTATIGISPLSNGSLTPGVIQASASPGPASIETFGDITVFRNISLDANGFLYLYRVQTPITSQTGIFGPGAGFYYDDFVVLNGEMILPGIAQVGVPMTLDLAHSARSIASGGFQLESAGELNALNNFGMSHGGAYFDLPAGYSVDSVSLGVVGNTVTSLAGDLTIRNDPSLTTINAASLVTVSGNLDISGDTATSVINVGSLTTVGGSLDIVGNTDAAVIDAGSLVTVSGSVDISDNGSATVSLGALTTVSGSLNLETTGSGVFDAGMGQIGGSLDLTATGYDEVDAMTAAGQTAVTMINGAATMEMVVPEGAFPVGDHVSFSVKQLAADPAETWGQNPTSTLAEYQFDFAITTLGQDATLNFAIDLAALGPEGRSALLDLLHAHTPLTLAVLGDDPDAQLQTFDVCGAGADPSSGCVAVRWLDEDGQELVPFGDVDPSVLKFDALVGHFSTYSIVAVNIPEPATLLLLLSGALVICSRRFQNGYRLIDVGH